MTAAELLATVRAAGVELTPDGDRLHVNAPRGALDDDRWALLAMHKADLLALLTAESESRRPWMTLEWPATSTVPTVKGHARRLDDGSILADYTRDELRLALALAGADVAALGRGAP